MRMTQAMVPTLRSVPAEAEIISHQLLLRAGFIRKTAAGMYNYLPLGKRVLTKIETIVREEMDAAGGQEILMPITQPAELWIESGRWNAYGAEMIRLKDRHDREFCLGPTHEEVVTDLVRNEVNSYRQLPLRLYQIQNKYRDERRPRFGLMRGREFIMKDLYSFDRDEAGLDESYNAMYQAYSNIFTRCGLTFRPVEADSGAIGGGYTHEFMVLADNGEATIVYCDSCDYAADIEIAPCADPAPAAKEELLPMEKVATPNSKTIDAVGEFLHVPAEKCIKTLFVQADNELICVLLRGNSELNDVKLKRIHPCDSLEMADPEVIREKIGCSIGSLGPVGLKGIKIYADLEMKTVVNGVCGANEEEYHYINVNVDRDYQIEGYYDLRMMQVGEHCPHCGAVLKQARGIEVGQVFKLGTKYSKAMHATFLDENGKENIIQMGCYGIGVSRTLAAAVEQNYDEDGIIWPKTIAPYTAVIVPVSDKNADQMRIAEELYFALTKAGIDVMLDDRAERAGVKFKDADLIGYPVRITVGKKAASEGLVEYKLRTEKEAADVAISDVVAKVQAFLAE